MFRQNEENWDYITDFFNPSQIAGFKHWNLLILFLGLSNCRFPDWKWMKLRGLGKKMREQHRRSVESTGLHCMQNMVIKT